MTPLISDDIVYFSLLFLSVIFSNSLFGTCDESLPKQSTREIA